MGLLNAGLSVEQIAAERQLAKSTIESHLSRAVEGGRISIFKYMTEEEVNEIIEARKKLPEDFSSKDLFVLLKGKYGYGQIRAVMGHLKNLLPEGH